MLLSEQQYLFAKDMNTFTNYLIKRGIKFTIGECWRRPSTQLWLYEKGWSKTKTNSMHLYKLAEDIFVWINGKFMKNTPENKELVKPLGTMWENLNPDLNRWGGNFETRVKGKLVPFIDLAHYERRKVK